MKKCFVLILAVMLLMVSSASAEAIRIGVMSGPTGMGMAQLMNAQHEAYSFEVYAAPTEATADLASGALDMLCLPTNTAANMANAKEDYVSVLAVNCLGTLYLAVDDTMNVAQVSDLAGQTVYAGVMTSTTGPILQDIFAANQAEVTIEWEADHDAVIARMLQGEVHAVVLPEPKMTVALTKAEGWQVVLNISTEWNKIHENRLPMGCIVARNDFIKENKDAVDQFLADYAASIAFIGDAANREESANMIAEAGVLPAAGVAKKALGNLDGSIVYVDGEEMKADLQAFYDVIAQPQPADAFYYAK